MSSSLNPNDPNFNFDEIMKCYICMCKIQDASMCPNCQKLSCQRCIQKWLMERKNQCPHCRMPLKLSQIINIRFMNELSHIIENINSTKKQVRNEMCKEHNVTILYFCITCNESLCSDCYMFGNKHKDHEINKIDIIYTKHVDNIKAESKEIQKKCDLLNSSLKDINDKIIAVGSYKLEKSNELEEIFDSMKTKLENRIHLILTKLMSCKNEISDKLKYLETVKQNLEKELNESPKSLLISKSEELVKHLKSLNVHSSTLDQKVAEHVNLNISTEIPSDIFPPYESAVFVIKDYKKIIAAQVKEQEVIYSPQLLANGLIWRLKVYPYGNGGAKGEFISAFLELVEGLHEISKYFYKIELCNFLYNKDKKYSHYSREFSSDFTNGECWGYNRFYKIENLEREGFVDSNDTIELKFFVRPQTYAQLSRDMKNYSLALEKKLRFYINSKPEKKTEDEEHSEDLGEPEVIRTSEEIAMNHFNMINNINNAEPVLEQKEENMEKDENQDSMGNGNDNPQKKDEHEQDEIEKVADFKEQKNENLIVEKTNENLILEKKNEKKFSSKNLSEPQPQSKVNENVIEIHNRSCNQVEADQNVIITEINYKDNNNPNSNIQEMHSKKENSKNPPGISSIPCNSNVQKLNQMMHNIDNQSQKLHNIEEIEAKFYNKFPSDLGNNGNYEINLSLNNSDRGNNPVEGSSNLLNFNPGSNLIIPHRNNSNDSSEGNLLDYSVGSSFGSLMDSIKFMEENAFGNNKQHLKNIQKYKTKDLTDEHFTYGKNKNSMKQGGKIPNEIFSLYPENSFKYQKAGKKLYPSHMGYPKNSNQQGLNNLGNANPNNANDIFTDEKLRNLLTRKKLSK